ncbi:TetR/AcrR family transcriptional regulator [Dictyobacter arantiisoli]|uniref:TetR family transcriptional regulator n=1 Tax=Dictyobacter arantiisoli TaxID=2014874 RepID=A0A5A5TAH6_9CHLR|nr:TetR/AcrR family transcriptional regulator [Dictyobacter arantiisoli]GCF08491.1 TetR family transcriptional regulator [Dictyobacter arantiisoli]
MKKIEAPSRQQERVELILRVAAEQLVRWGYKKITINDIAQQAGIGTGTIYLHWKTRESLFQAVMLREISAVWDEMLERMRHDYREFYPHRMMRSLLLITMQRPIAHAMFIGDGELLGKLVQNKLAIQTRMMRTPDQFVTLLRDQGLMQTNMSVHMQQYALSAAVTGFCLVDPLIAEEDRVSLEERVDALAYVIRQSFEPPELVADDVMREVVAPRMLTFFEQMNTDLSQQLQMMMSL